MPQRALYIAAYDISDAARLRQALYILKGYATGGQKSVFECFLTQTERQCLLSEVQRVVDADADRFILLQLEQRARVRTLGIAVPPVDPDYFYVG